MSKPKFLASAIILATCQSAFADTVYYCEGKANIWVLDDGTKLDQLEKYPSEQKFTMKVDEDSEGRPSVEFNNISLFGGQPWSITNYTNEGQWNAAQKNDGNWYIIAFKFPAFFRTVTSSVMSTVFNASCEKF